MTACVDCPRIFLFVHGDPGEGGHSLGQGLRVAAETHRKEVEANEFPFDVPEFRKDIDKSIVSHAGRGSSLGGLLSAHKGTLHYLAIFSHMGAGFGTSEDIDENFSMTYQRTGLMFLGDASAPDTNLGSITAFKYTGRTPGGTAYLTSHPTASSDELAARNTNMTPVSSLPTDVFYVHPKSQVRLFGCYGAVGTDGDPKEWSIAEAMGKHLKVLAYGFNNDGGSMMTSDKTLGHGGRSSTAADRNKRSFKATGNLWFVPFVGKINFKKF